MAVAKGDIDVRLAGSALVFEFAFKDATGQKVTGSTATMRMFELQDDGSLKSYDFDDNTFKTTALTTATLALSHRTGNNGTYNTGVWTAAVSTLTGFTAGARYFVEAAHASAMPPETSRLFTYSGAGVQVGLVDDAITAGKIADNAIGSDQLAADAIAKVQSGLATPGDEMDLNTTARANLQSDFYDLLGIKFGASHQGTVNDVAPAADSFNVDVIATDDDFYNQQIIVFTTGNLAGQARIVTSYAVGADKVVTVNAAFTEAPANGDSFSMVPISYSGSIAAGFASTAATQATAANINAQSAGITAQAILAALGPITGSVNAAGSTTTTFPADLVSGVTDFYKGGVVLFTSGALDGQARRITAWTLGVNSTVTVDVAFTEAPEEDDDFIVIPSLYFSGSGGDGDFPTVDEIADAVYSRLGSGVLQIESPVKGGLITLYQGDSYEGAYEIPLSITDYTGSSLDGKTCYLRIKTWEEYKAGGTGGVTTSTDTIVHSGTTVSTTFTLTGAESEAIEAATPEDQPQYVYQWRVLLESGKEKTLAFGRLHLIREVA